MEYYINNKKVTWEKFIKWFNNIDVTTKGKIEVTTNKK